MLCLEKSASVNHNSIAFPALGMGVKGFPTDVVAKSMIEAITEYSETNPNSSLTLINVYLFEKSVTPAQVKVS